VLAAASWGTGDFCGGLAARRISTMATVAASQAIGVVLAALLVAVSAESVPGPQSLLWGALAGLAGLGGVACFYRALATGEMSLAAPLVAVVSAGLPAGIGIITGDRLDPYQGGGLVCGLLAVLIISRTADDPEAQSRSRATVRSMPLLLLAGLGFAAFFLAISRATATGEGAIWWPLLAARATTVVVAGAALLLVPVLRRRPGLPSADDGVGVTGAAGAATPDAAGVASAKDAGAARSAGSLTPSRRGAMGVLLLVTMAGLGDLGGNGFFLLADQGGPFSLAVILSSLYPVMTVLLAGWLLRERLSRPQLGGIGLALAGVVMIAL
jgi:drug/metabolite transporter (DMT)-like permease